MDELDMHYEPKAEKYEKDVAENKAPSRPPTFSVGDHVAAVWSTDQQWYRGQVASVKQEMYEVFLFDYGDTTRVGEPYIWPLHSKFSALPKQAIKAALSGKIMSPRWVYIPTYGVGRKYKVSNLRGFGGNLEIWGIFSLSW